jgi:hypothetical protein
MGASRESPPSPQPAPGLLRRLQVLARFALLLLLPLLGLRAQEDPVGPGSAPLYEVELIAFRHLDQRANTPEVETAATGPAAEVTADMETAGQTGTAPDPAFETSYPTLGPQSLRLAGIAAKLGRDGSYQLLYHGGWVQAAERQNQARPTPLPPEAALNGGVQGGITLYRERYLHVLVDVSLGEQRQEQRIRQGRRLRGQATQYFDHPQFGVILAVRPVGGEASTDSPDQAISSEKR